MQKRGKTALTLVGFAVMLAALLALMAGIGAKKDGFDIDEFFTYGLANSYHQPFLNTETGRWISGKAFSDYLTASGHAHEYLNVYENQIADVHPPLYYLFVHAVCSVFRDPPFTKWTGIGLNLFFFSLTQLGLLLLSARLLSDGERLTLTPSALLPGLLYGLSAGAASSVVFIRMYAMMTMWAVWLALALAALWVGGQTVWRMRALAAVLIAGFLTQYYFVVLACMLCGAYFFARLARREFAAAGRFALWCFFALALAVGLFPWCLNHIFGGYRGKGAMESAAALRLSDMCRWFKILWQTLDAQQFGGLLLALVCVGAALAFWPLKKAGQGLLRGAGLSAAALLACAAYVLVIAVVSPYKVDRYIFCVYPLATVALFMLFARGGCRFGSRRGSACLLACAVLAACGARVNRGQQVHYLYPGDSAYLAACEENAALPCVVLGTNDMTQNTLELAAFDRVFLLDADDAQGVAPALEALGEEPDGFIFFERYHDEANIETVLRTTGLERAERLFEHQYQVYWVH